jgi:hypothetical protein
MAMKKGSNDSQLAKRETISEIIPATWRGVKRGVFLMLITVTLFTLSSCDKKINGQAANEQDKEQAMATRDTLGKPKVNIQVNRHFDEKGNLIGFDSTYSTFYGSAAGDTIKMDSLMHSFDRYFNRNHSTFFNRQLDPLFFEDSLRYPDFFHNDFFMRRYELNDDYFKGMMKRMDSIKNHYFYEQSKQLKDPKRI